MKIAIIYDSITGNTKKIAEEIKKDYRIFKAVKK